MANDGGNSVVRRIRAFVASTFGKASEIASPRSPEEALERRRSILNQIDHPLEHAPGAMGIAFSGGGIRSATVSLGVAQELARQDRLLDFDYCSTVSGGGYFGSFLGAMFLPPEARGSAAVAGNTKPAVLARQSAFAHAALTSEANVRRIADPTGTQKVQNPVWWLREHSRYLAPDGGSDYFVAAAYMIRNWIAMTFVLALPVALACLAAIALTADLLHRGGPIATFIAPLRGSNWALSPLWLASAGAALFALSAGIAYWLTEFMVKHFPTKTGRVSLPRLILISVGAASIGLAALLLRHVFSPGAFAEGLRTLRALVAIGAGCTILGGVFAVVTAIAIPVSMGGNPVPVDAVIAEARRRFTRLSASLLGVMLVVAAMALIDTLGMSAFNWLLEKNSSDTRLFGGLGTLLSPAIAWLVHKLPGMLSGRESRIGTLLSKWIWTIALIAGVAMLLTLTLSVHVLAQSVVFDAPWTTKGQELLTWSFPWVMSGTAAKGFVFAVWTIGALTVLTGASTGFINLSSLHGLYASRLTRAYVGASNMRRLGTLGGYRQKGITESDPGDQIPAQVYFRQPTAGPIHLVNVTLNETKSRDGSQLLNRDRKGVPLVFAPEGAWVDPARGEAPYTWERQATQGVEALSVGQLCAISGAAASSAMGSRTTLGGALAFTLANIRLGYWWEVNDMIRGRVTGGKWLWHRATRAFRTYFYLCNEMRGSYSRDFGRLNISDGGHFENSGAYELLRRRVKLILVCDNGADPEYDFEDLELLIRKARIDLGLSTTVVDPVKVQSLVGKRGADRFLNGSAADWRARAKAESCQDTGFALMLEARDLHDSLVSRLIWLKPRCFQGVPHDVAGYATRNAAFPQEGTGDQFFDEAQWESYRALGNAMAEALFADSRDGRDVLRKLIP